MRNYLALGCLLTIKQAPIHHNGPMSQPNANLHDISLTYIQYRINAFQSSFGKFRSEIQLRYLQHPGGHRGSSTIAIIIEITSIKLIPIVRYYHAHDFFARFLSGLRIWVRLRRHRRNWLALSIFGASNMRRYFRGWRHDIFRGHWSVGCLKWIWNYLVLISLTGRWWRGLGWDNKYLYTYLSV
jgi:hypothetical protein